MISRLHRPISLLPLLLAVFLIAVPVSAALAADDEPPIDPVRGRMLMQKASRGETLTPEEQAYLDRVKAEIRRRALAKLAATQPQAATARLASTSRPAGDWSSLVPITDMTAPYKGEDGGLYGSGHNEPPKDHLTAYLKESEKIRPLDADGQPADGGKIGLITIGFSNTSIESKDFKLVADADPQKSPRVVIVNGAIGSRSAVMWAWDGDDVLPKTEQDRLDTEMDTVHMLKANRRGQRRGQGHLADPGASGSRRRACRAQAGAGVLAQARRGEPQAARRIPGPRPGAAGRHHRHPQHRAALLPQPAHRLSVKPHLRRLVGTARAAAPSLTPTNRVSPPAGSCKARSRATPN